MSTSRFDYCIAFVLEHETEYNRDGSVRVEHDPHDPGGTTKYGIDQRSHPNVDVAHLSLDEAKQIYYDGEWTKCRCGELPPGWDLAVFDAAINCGQSRAIGWAQEVTGTKVDGFIGPKTIAAIKISGFDGLNKYVNRRSFYYEHEVRTELRLRFGKGWANRVADLQKTVIADDGMLA